jgi:hypothetical protein
MESRNTCLTRAPEYYNTSNTQLTHTLQLSIVHITKRKFFLLPEKSMYLKTSYLLSLKDSKPYISNIPICILELISCPTVLLILSKNLVK